MTMNITLNQRVPGSSPGAPTNVLKFLADRTEAHSDNASPAHSDNLTVFVPMAPKRKTDHDADRYRPLVLLALCS